MFPLGPGKMTQYLGANGVCVAIRKGLVGVVALHLGLPIGFESCQNLFQLGTAEGGGRHGASPCVLLRIRHFAGNSH